MNDRMRISDADREQVIARLRDHFAEGRLTSDELDERITAALSAKTFGDLHKVMVDLPDPDAVRPEAGQMPPWATWPAATYRRRRPRLLPLALLVLILAVVLPGAGFVLFAFLKVMLLIFLVTCLAGMFACFRFRRHARRFWQSGQFWQPGTGSQWHDWDWHR